MDPAEIFVEEVVTRGFAGQDGRLQPPQEGRDCGTSVRVWTPMGDRYACQAGLGENPLRSCLDRLGGKTSGWPVDLEWYAGGDFSRAGWAPPAGEPLAGDRAVGWLRETEEAACRDLPGLFSCRVGLREVSRRRRILLPDGTVRVQSFCWAAFSLVVSVRVAGRILQGRFRGAREGLAALLDCFHPGRCAESARRDLSESREAVRGASGEMPVVLAGEAAGVFFHEVFGHILEGDAQANGASWFEAGVKGRIAPRGLAVFDDATIPGLGGSTSMDDEGTPCGRVPLIEEGRVIGRLLDGRGARLRGVPSTGNGRRASYRDRPLPRISNLCVAGGGAGIGEAIGSCGVSGLLVEELASGRVDPFTGEFRLAVGRGFRIERGRPGEPVRGLLLGGAARQALAGMEVVEADGAAVRSTGNCVKEGQGLLTGLCSPPVRIRQLSVWSRLG